MGSVYLARDTTLGRTVAIKLLQQTTPEFSEMFIREARATAKCICENIVILYHVSEHGNRPYLVLEYVQGKTLQQILDGLKNQRMPEKQVIDILSQIANALVCAHSHGVVHRDLKPENVMVTSNGVVKILDFGIAKQVQEKLNPATVGASLKTLFKSIGNKSSNVSNGIIKGTLRYMSPEQLLAGNVDEKSDIWSLGIIAWRSLTGKHPFANCATIEDYEIVRDLSKPVARLNSVAANVSGELAAIVDSCLRKRAAERPDAAELLAELKRYAEKLKSTRQKRNIAVGAIIGLSLFVAGLCAAFGTALVAKREAVRQAELARLAESSARKSEQNERTAKEAAQRSEAIARRAEEEVREVLAKLQQKEQDRAAAEQSAASARRAKNKAEMFAEKRGREMKEAEEEKESIKSKAKAEQQRRNQQLGIEPAADLK